ncbi:hypothetical protein ACJX0J_038769, partial [Zea mays]
QFMRTLARMTGLCLQIWFDFLRNITRKMNKKMNDVKRTSTSIHVLASVGGLKDERDELGFIIGGGFHVHVISAIIQFDFIGAHVVGIMPGVQALSKLVKLQGVLPKLESLIKQKLQTIVDHIEHNRL